MAIPKETLEYGLKLAKGADIYGVRMESLSRDELLALAAIGWDKYGKSLQGRG